MLSLLTLAFDHDFVLINMTIISSIYNAHSLTQSCNTCLWPIPVNDKLQMATTLKQSLRQFPTVPSFLLGELNNFFFKFHENCGRVKRRSNVQCDEIKVTRVF